MASNSAVSNQQQHFQQPNSQHHCKECGLFFDSSKSLEVHLQYHKENLLNKWATQASQGSVSSGSAAAALASAAEETNNNTSTKTNNNSKRELSGAHPNTIAAAADSSDSSMLLGTPGAKSAGSNKSPDSYGSGSRATPEAVSAAAFGHPPTPQSYSSAPSPYQQQQPESAAAFSPGYQPYPQSGAVTVKGERVSPLPPSHHYGGGGYQQQHLSHQQHMYLGGDGSQQQQQYFGMDQQLGGGYPQDYPMHKLPSSGQGSAFRYHPYQHPGAAAAAAAAAAASSYERSPQVSSSSPAYPAQNPQPTPSPSPKQCDKCGCVCDSAAQLLDHLSHAHPSTPGGAGSTQQQHMYQQQQQQQNQQHFSFAGLDKQPQDIKTEEEQQTEILDLDSHKVHQVFQSPEEEDAMKRHNGDLSAALNGPNPHSVSAMLGTGWPSNGAVSAGDPTGRGMYLNGPISADLHHHHAAAAAAAAHHKMYVEQKLFQPHQMHSPDFLGNGVTTTTNDGGVGYRPFENMAAPQPGGASVISSTQLAGGAASGGGSGPVGPGGVGGPTPSSGPKGQGPSWKSNEARRPKTYNCSACNKWFTSSGHLKRHYNTTLHKNAVKTSGQPDPATMPISAHHHPGRESRGGGGNGSDPGGASHGHSPDPGDDVISTRLLDDGGGGPMSGLLQQPPSGPYDRQQQHSSLHSPGHHGLSNLSGASPPNGEAGPSASTNQDHSRGLLSISTASTPHQLTPLSPMVASMSSSSSNSSTISSSAGPPSSGATNHHHLSPGFSLLNQPAAHLMGTDTTPLTSHHNTHLLHHHHQQQQHSHLQHQHQQPVFQTMSPASIPPTYPNGLAPHVMPITGTSSPPPALTSLTTTGDSSAYEYIQLSGVGSLHQQQQQQHEHLHQQQQQALLQQQLQQQHHQQQLQYLGQMSDEQQQPLPSFAQFNTTHRYGMLLAAGYPPSGTANVGGLSPVTDSTHHHHLQQVQQQQQQEHHQQQLNQQQQQLHIQQQQLNQQQQQHHHHQQQQQIYVPVGSSSPSSYTDGIMVYRVSGDDDYEVTAMDALESSDDGGVTSQPQQQQQNVVTPYSPPTTLNNNNNNNTLSSMQAATVRGSNNKTGVTSPAGGATAKDEQLSSLKRDYENGSPQITSTGSPLGAKQAAAAGVHKCFDCDKLFNKACYLTQHNKTFHCGDKPFKCHRCGKRFSSEPAYQEHLAKHAGDKPYKCELCPKQFNHKTDLRRHMCLHTGQKPYACQHCGKGFIRKDHMLKHADTHSRKANNKHHHQNNGPQQQQQQQSQQQQHGPPSQQTTLRQQTSA